MNFTDLRPISVMLVVTVCLNTSHIKIPWQQF